MSRLILFCALLFFQIAKAQVEGVIVETYYISDSSDATDTTGGNILQPGSVTYRIYIDLAAGNKLRKIYGDSFHPLIIASTQEFYNNLDRPNANFGYLINKSWFNSNPLLALDSWISLGLATKTHNGILKSEDADGSVVGGVNNNGGSAGVAGGLLVNVDSLAGIPLTVTDGLTLSDSILSQWIDFGIKDLNGDDTTIFGAINSGSVFTGSALYLQQNAGVTGASPVENKILVAQLTTKGDISFELNIEVELPDGTVVQYVANGDTLINHPPSLLNEQLSPFLKYPPECGCTDPDYLEYNAAFSCGLPDSCMTLVVLGCMDPDACNYNPDANYNVQALCCYPGNCDDRDLSVVCPALGSNNRTINVFPNPSEELVNVEISGELSGHVIWTIYNSFGRRLNAGTSELYSFNVDITGLLTGIYIMHITTNDYSGIRAICKN